MVVRNGCAREGVDEGAAHGHRQYLAFIHQYTQLHRQAPAESDYQRHFKVSPPSVHRMIIALEKRRLIRRDPGQARSVRVLLEADEIPDLDG